MAHYDFKFNFSEVENIKPRQELSLEEVALDNRDAEAAEALDNFLNN